MWLIAVVPTFVIGVIEDILTDRIARFVVIYASAVAAVLLVIEPGGVSFVFELIPTAFCFEVEARLGVAVLFSANMALPLLANPYC